MVAKDHFSWCTVTLGNVSFSLKMILQVRDKKTPPCFPSYSKCFHKWCAPIPSTRLAASRKLQTHFFCFKSFTHAQNTSENKSALFPSFAHAQRAQSDFGKFRHKHFGYSQKKSKRQHLLLFFKNDRIRNFWEAICILERAIYFPEQICMPRTPDIQ